MPGCIANLMSQCPFLSYQAFTSGEGAVAGDQEGSEKRSQEHHARTPNCDCQDASFEFLKSKCVTSRLQSPMLSLTTVDKYPWQSPPFCNLLPCLEPNDGSLLLPERTLDSQRCASCTIRPAPRTLPGGA